MGKQSDSNVREKNVWVLATEEDRKTFADFAKLYERKLLRKGEGRFRRPEDAEDALQDIYVSIINASRKSKPTNVKASRKSKPTNVKASRKSKPTNVKASRKSKPINVPRDAKAFNNYMLGALKNGAESLRRKTGQEVFLEWNLGETQPSFDDPLRTLLEKEHDLLEYEQGLPEKKRALQLKLQGFLKMVDDVLEENRALRGGKNAARQEHDALISEIEAAFTAKEASLETNEALLERLQAALQEEQAKRKAMLNSEIPKLPPTFRPCFTKLLEGKTNQEIAAETGHPVDTVGVYISNCRNQLRKALGELGEQHIFSRERLQQVLGFAEKGVANE